MELLPCPFCGGEALPTAHLTYNWFAPVCGRCNARGPSVKIERDSDPQEMRNLMNQADENWNRRASPASVPEDRTQAGVRPAPVLIGDVVEADCAELRDIAAWFESRGNPMQGEFLRKVADRYEVIFGAYWTATVRGSSVVA